MKAFLFGVVALVAALPAAAQVVGYPPSTSPYSDLEFSQELTAEFGYMKARHDPAGAAPKSAAMIGLRYDISLVGPLALSSEVTRTFSNRDVIDPALPAAQRNNPLSVSSPVYSADLALALNLTGRKSWHYLVPQVRAGIGVLTASASDAASGYSFGTPFAFTFGGGVKVVPPGSRVQLRADLTDRVFKLSYPDSFYRLASDNTALLDATVPRSFYTHQLGMTLGVSYLFGR